MAGKSDAVVHRALEVVVAAIDIEQMRRQTEMVATMT